MTGFRLAPGGAQERLGVAADIVTFGKVIGGGLPVGAFASSHEIMRHLAPEGPVYQAGTLSGNPLAMAAGFSMLKTIKEQPEIFDRLEEKTKALHDGFASVLAKLNIPCQINRLGSMLSVHFTSHAVVDFKSAATGNNNFFKRYFHGLLAEGIYLPPSAFESYFLNDALSYQDIDKTIVAFKKVVSKF
jgi:glutamate-1-semialdehyde 2,1-aminomutase